MKNKLIFNILIIYFIILGFILIFQVTNKKNEDITAKPTEITIKDKLKNSVILNIDSPIILVNEKQYLIDENDSTITPIIENGKVYIPVVFLKKAFNANISFSPSRKETTVRLDNKALIFSNEDAKINIIDIKTEKVIETEYKAKIIGDRFYIHLRTFADIFKKELFIYNNLIIISDIEDILDPVSDINIINQISSMVNFLNIVGNYENLQTISSKFDDELYQKLNKTINQINIKNIIKENANNSKFLIKSTNTFNFYINNGLLEVFKNVNSLEKFEFNLKLDNLNLLDVFIYKNKLILCFDNDIEKISKILIYDISNYENIQLLNELSITGDLFKVYLYGKNIYFFSNYSINENINNVQVFSKYVYKNNKKLEENNQIFSLNKINYFPDINDKLFTSIISLNLENLSENLNTHIFFGMGKNIIFDNNNLIISTTNNNKSNVYLFNLNLGKLNFIKRISINTEILDISKSIFIEDDTIKINVSPSKNIIYTKNLEEISS